MLTTASAARTTAVRRTTQTIRGCAHRLMMRVISYFGFERAKAPTDPRESGDQCRRTGIPGGSRFSHNTCMMANCRSAKRCFLLIASSPPERHPDSASVSYRSGRNVDESGRRRQENIGDYKGGTAATKLLILSDDQARHGLHQHAQLRSRCTRARCSRGLNLCAGRDDSFFVRAAPVRKRDGASAS